MPNHVVSQVTAKLSVLQYLVRVTTVAEEERRAEERRIAWGNPAIWGNPVIEVEEPQEMVDFGILIPEPPNIERDGCNLSAELEVRDGNLVHPRTGKVCWYDWNNRNWGTKWNGYSLKWLTSDGLRPVDVSDSEPFTIEFQTAWNIPSPVFDKLAEVCKPEPIHIEYADEDLGSNVGIIDYWLDRDVYRQKLDGTVDGRRLAERLHGIAREDRKDFDETEAFRLRSGEK